MAGERSADDIQRDIERSRAALAAAVDQLAYRGNPKRIVEKTKRSLLDKTNSPQGRAVIAAAGGVLVLVVVRRVQNGRATSAAAKAAARPAVTGRTAPARRR